MGQKATSISTEKPKPILISSVDPELRKNLTTYLQQTGISLTFYVQKAIREKLEKDQKIEK